MQQTNYTAHLALARGCPQSCSRAADCPNDTYSGVTFGTAAQLAWPGLTRAEPGSLRQVIQSQVQALGHLEPFCCSLPCPRVLSQSNRGDPLLPSWEACWGVAPSSRQVPRLAWPSCPFSYWCRVVWWVPGQARASALAPELMPVFQHIWGILPCPDLLGFSLKWHLAQSSLGTWPWHPRQDSVGPAYRQPQGLC